MGGTNKGGMGKANIEADKKVGARAVANTDNSADGGGNVMS